MIGKHKTLSNRPEQIKFVKSGIGQHGRFLWDARFGSEGQANDQAGCILVDQPHLSPAHAQGSGLPVQMILAVVCFMQ